MMEKEARTNKAGADLDKRNRNWEKINTHLAEKATDSVHGATSSGSANTIVSRDMHGRMFGSSDPRLLRVGQTLVLADRLASGFVSNPSLTSTRVLGSNDGTSETMLLIVTVATGANTSIQGAYLVARQGRGHSVVALANISTLTVSITADHKVKLTASGTVQIICSLISLGGI